MNEPIEKLPFGMSWNQIYGVLILCHILIIILFILFSNTFS